MLSIPASVRIFIHREPVDFRKSHDGLSGIIRRDLKEDPLSGDLFAFLNKRRDRVKLIQFDGNGLWLHYKRLENGTFRRPTANVNGTARYTRADLALLLEGIEVKKGKLMRRFADSMRIPERTSDGANHRRTSEGPRGVESARGPTEVRERSAPQREPHA
jgi:transposase